MENFISRWKLNCENFSSILTAFGMSEENFVEKYGWKFEQRIISDFVANEIVKAIEIMLDEAETQIKAVAVKLITVYCVQFTKTDKEGVPYQTPKILGIDKLYKDENGCLRSRWLLFYYLFNLDEKQSTLVDRLDADERAEF